MKFLRLLVICLFLSPAAFAQDNALGDLKDLSNLSYFEVMKRSVFYGAQADAYGAFCQKPSHIGQSLITAFVNKKKIDEKQRAAFEIINQETHKITLSDLQAKGQDCTMIEVTMQRFEIMRNLKNLSYLLNGVDPKDIPQDPPIPNMAELMGSQSQ